MICSEQAAVGLVADGATVLVDGSGGGVNEPDLILAALEQRFLATGHPRDLTLLHVSGIGDGHGGGIDRFAHEGMVRRVIGGHWGWSPRMQDLAFAGEVEAYCLPQGTMSHLLRDIAAGRPGVISAVGLGTFIDPRCGGGKLNAAAREDIVELIELAGREWIFTPSFPIDVAIIRATVADTHGNLSMYGEGLLAETLSAAQAARNSKGIVIAQVRQIVQPGTLDSRSVRVPGILVDAVVVHPGQRLSNATGYDPCLTGELRLADTSRAPMPLTQRKVIARRATLELRAGDVINLGFGMPDGVSQVLTEEGLADQVTFTVEQGHIGGVPVGGTDFGMCLNADASIDAGHQFDWYDGGGLDVAILSFAETDAAGNVNVGKFGKRMPGVGGFVNISQGAKRVVFVGTLVVGGTYQVGTDRPIAVPDNGQAKFVAGVEQVDFSAARALAIGQPVTYVTERAVFRLVHEGIELTEVAPDLDVEADVLRHMSFRPLISPHLGTMDGRCFGPEPMRLALPRELPPAAPSTTQAPSAECSATVGTVPADAGTAGVR